jgi:hypothetical protein
MTRLAGTRDQQSRDFMYDASGTIIAGGTPQLLLPEAKSRTVLIFANLSTGILYLEFDGARATATLTNGVVTGYTITNPGFGYTFPPSVECEGGGPGIGPPSAAAGMPGYVAPGSPDGFIYRIGDLSKFRPAKLHAVLGTGGAAGTVASLTIEDGGAGYQQAPFIHIFNNIARDVYGCADPSYNSGSGIPIFPNAGYYINGTACPTGPIAVYGATTGQAFTLKWMS